MKRLPIIFFLLFSVCAIAQTSIPNNFAINLSGTGAYTGTYTGQYNLLPDFTFKARFQNGNPGAATLNLTMGIGATGVKEIKDAFGNTLTGGEITPSVPVWLTYISGADHFRLEPGFVRESVATWGSITGTLSDQTDLQSDLALKAPLASPALTGTPTVPTATAGTSTNQAASTEFVTSAIDNISYGVRGQLFSETFASTSNFTTTGAISISVLANILTVSGGDTGNQQSFARYARYTPYVTALDKWTLEATYTVGTYNSTSFGLGFGLQSIANNSASRFGLGWGLDNSSSGTGGKIYAYYINPSGTPVALTITANGVLPLALNDVISMIVSRDESKIYFTFKNETQQKEISAYALYSLSLGATAFLPNKANFTIYAKGGTNTVSVFKASSSAKKGGLLFLGDSKSKYYANEQAFTYTNRISSNIGKPVISLAQASHLTSDCVDLLPEIIAMEPDTVIIDIGTNDVEHTNLATFQTQMDLLTDGLDAEGIPYFINEIIGRNDGRTVSTFNDWLNTTYPSDIIIGQKLAFSDGTAQGARTTYMADVVHMNPVGHELFANNILNKLKISRNITTTPLYPLQGLINLNYAPLATNSLSFTNAASGSNPTFTAAGNDTNVGINFATKGTGSFNFTNAGTGGTTFTSTGGATIANFVSSNSVATVLQMSHTGVRFYSFQIAGASYGGGVAAGSLIFRDATSSISRIVFSPNATLQQTGIGVDAPTAALHLKAGTTTSGSGQIKLNEGVNPSINEDGLINYVSNNLTFTEGSTVYTIAKTITGTGTLNFDLTSVNSEDLTITVTGAADGDPVSFSVPAASATANVQFTAWVSATNTVTVRAARIDVASGADPASGTFRASVIHY